MTPSLGLLTALTPTSDTNPLSTDYAKHNNIVLPPFGALTAHPVTVCSGPLPIPFPTGSTSECDAYDASSSLMNHTRALAAQWTGAPIRAIVPLPRRTRVLNGNNNAPATSASAHAHTRTTVRGRPRRRMRLVHLDRMDSRADNEGRGEEDEDDQESDEDEDRGVASASRYRSYESITAAEGLAAWSFEELRVECYAQSLVARGTKPPPVVQPSLAIPPAFVSRIVPRNS